MKSCLFIINKEKDTDIAPIVIDDTENVFVGCEAYLFLNLYCCYYVLSCGLDFCFSCGTAYHFTAKIISIVSWTFLVLFQLLPCWVFSQSPNLIPAFTVLTFTIFHDGGPYHIETSPLICRADHWNGFYVIGTSVMKELKNIAAVCISKWHKTSQKNPIKLCRICICCEINHVNYTRKQEKSLASSLCK